MRHTFRLPESGSPEIVVDQSQLTGLSVSVEGARLARLRERGVPSWQIPMADGTTRRISIGGQLRGLHVIVEDDGIISLERRLALWELLFAVLPFGLLGLTGIPGGVLGLVAILVNLRVLRLPWPLPLRILATLVTLVLAGVGSYLIARVLFA
ncbi:MAG: hypothetical protein M3P84_11090 [Chloroflexota bacterium]|nr:hypothetical protein [Chloroflexota bacterium]